MPPLVLARFGAFRRPGETTIPITHKHNSFLFLFTDWTVYAQQATRQSPAGWLPWMRHVRKSISSPVHRSHDTIVDRAKPQTALKLDPSQRCLLTAPRYQGILYPGMHQESLRYLANCTSSRLSRFLLEDANPSWLAHMLIDDDGPLHALGLLGRVQAAASREEVEFCKSSFLELP